jgi:hypothetical protein
LAPLCKKCLGTQRHDPQQCAWESLPDWFVGDPGHYYYCHVDLGTGGTKGSGRDACGLAIGHRGEDVERNGIILPSVVIDLSIRFKASGKKMVVHSTEGGKTTSKKKGEEIDISAVREFILRLGYDKGFNFAKITYDGFQSLETLQTFEKMGYLAEKVGCTKDSWDNMRTMWYDNRIDIFYDNWLLYEMNKLEDKGAKVDHAVGASNDEGECVARVIEMAVEGELPVIKKPRAIPKMRAAFRGVANMNPQAMRIHGRPRAGRTRRGPFFR